MMAQTYSMKTAVAVFIRTTDELMMAQTYSMKTAVAVFIRTADELMMAQIYSMKTAVAVFIWNLMNNASSGRQHESGFADFQTTSNLHEGK
ncbi:MAG: hypothetical protein PHF64_05450 [Methanoregula sp.]|nr:hypothetical protein [Methanoregula sp.]